MLISRSRKEPSAARVWQAGQLVKLPTSGLPPTSRCGTSSCSRTNQGVAVILDLGLPGRPGLEVLAAWRAAGNAVPVVILTARDSWQEKVEGLKAGADDYLAKPFAFAELLARLQAVVRRAKGQASAQIEAGGLTLDEGQQQVRVGAGAPLELTGTEFRLLRVFMLHPGRPLSRTWLYEHVYGYAEERDSNVIEVYVRRLRDKLGAGTIETRRGQGYLFRGLAG